MNTPNDASDDTINRLFDIAAAITERHAADHAADPSLAARLDSDPSAMLAQANKLVNKVMLRHRDLPLVRAQIDPTIPVAKFCRALASEGLCVKNNAETRDLYVTYIEGPTSDDVTRAVQRSGNLNDPNSIQEC
jgi:hypothetical protein